MTNLGVLDGIEGQALTCHGYDWSAECTGHSQHGLGATFERIGRQREGSCVVEVQPVGQRLGRRQLIGIESGHSLQIVVELAGAAGESRRPAGRQRVQRSGQIVVKCGLIPDGAGRSNGHLASGHRPGSFEGIGSVHGP